MAILFLPLGAFAQTVSPLNLPLYFQANKNQSQFLASGGGCQFLVSSSGVQMAFCKPDKSAAAAQMQFVGANALAQIQGIGELPGKLNYLIGNDSSKWQTSLPIFSKVQVSGLYPGINLVFHGNQRQLEYDFDVAPRANPNAIKIHFHGVDKISISPRGELILKIGPREICQRLPGIYQCINGVRRTLTGCYKIVDPQTVAFAVGDYDRSRPLVIDPTLGYSSFFGGNSSTTAWAVALDTNDCIYIAGQTLSSQFATTGAARTNFAGGSYVGDAFVAKFSNPPTNLIYLTYLGGSDDDAAYCLAADGSGHAFVAGTTDSPDFPTNNALPGHSHISGVGAPSGHYFTDAFVTEVGTNGTNLIYSTYLGGESAEAAYGIALDSAGDAYVTGFTYSTNFPCTQNAIQTNLACINSVYLDANAFVAEITNGGGNLIYSTYLGGTNYDLGRAIFVDGSNDVYVTGFTGSTNFPVVNAPTNSFPTTGFLDGATNAFVTKFPPLATDPSSITDLVYSIFLGGTNVDQANGIAADANGDAYVTGWTASTNFPVSFPNTNGPTGLFSYLITNGVFTALVTNVFLTKISPSGDISYSAVFGGDSQDIGYGVAVDSAGDAFVVGSASSLDFPTMNYGNLAPTNAGGSDAFVTAFNPDGSSMLYSLCMGGVQNDYGYGIALDSSTNVYITGQTYSPNFPTLNGTRYHLQGSSYLSGTNYNGGVDSFFSEIAFAPGPVAPQITNAPPASTNLGVGQTLSFTVGVTGTPPLIYQWEFGTNQLDETNLVNGGQFSGTTNMTLTVANLQATNTGYYTVIVTNDWGSTSATVDVTVQQSPLISVPLTNQTVGIGSTVTFALTAYGTPKLHYEWLTNGFELTTNGGQFSGVTNSTLFLTDAQTTNSGTYTVIVTNAFGSVTDSANLTVLSAPVFTSISLTGSNFSDGLSFSGVGGASGAPYSVYTWTNLLTPLTNWYYLGTPNFDSQGKFNFTFNPEQYFGQTNYQTNYLWTNFPQEFFIIKQ